MRNILLAALCAAAATGAHAADWSRFVGSNPGFPNQLGDDGLAVDADGHVAVDAYNLAEWSGKTEFVHHYTFDADGAIPWIWGLTGRLNSDAIVPRGVALRQGHRTTWIERRVDPLDPWAADADEFGFAGPGTSQPWYWHVEPRGDGRVVRFVSAGTGGLYLLRALDAGAGVEVVALDAGGTPRWRGTVQPCGFGVDAVDLVLDYAPTGPAPTLGVAGTCPAVFGASQVFVQRLDAATGSAATPEWIAAPPGFTPARYAFSPAHEFVAVYATPWPMFEIRRIAAPGAPPAAPPVPVFGLASIDGFAPTAGDDLVAFGREEGSDYPALLPLGAASYGSMVPGAIVPFGIEDWRFAVGGDGRLLAWRKESAGGTTRVRLVGLDPEGQAVEWKRVIDDVLPAAQPQVAAVRDGSHGFVVAVDTQQPDGTIGVHVERVGSVP